MLTIELARMMIEEIHTSYSHIGIKKTYNLFKECFTSNSAHKIAKRLIKSCETCQKCKDFHKNGMGETKPIIPKGKGDLISADFYGPLPTSTSGVRYILVFVDNFTKYVKLYMIKRPLPQ